MTKRRIILACAGAIGLALGSPPVAAEEDAAPNPFGVEIMAIGQIAKDIGSAAELRGQSIGLICEFVRRADGGADGVPLHTPRDRCSVMAVVYNRLVADYAALVEHVAALDALTDDPVVDAVPLPPPAFLDHWENERRAVIAGIRRFLARERKLASDSERVELALQRSYGAPRANAALKRIGYSKRVAALAEILNRVRAAARALEKIPSFPTEPEQPTPKPAAPPSQPTPDDDRVPT